MFLELLIINLKNVLFNKLFKFDFKEMKLV